MENSFASCLLFCDDAGLHSLTRTQAAISPGSSLTIARQPGRVSIAGGFPAVTPDAPGPLSPALQLNSDLAGFSSEELHRIATAELARLDSTTFKSYTREPDNRVCVLGRNRITLTAFLETYGGILVIEPLLLHRSAPEYPCTEEIRIEKIPTGYRLRYLTRTPIDRDQCTYCGACGPVCPEDCLNPDLFLDLHRCTFCNRCVKVCPTGAIDLHRAGEIAQDVPALILLDDLQPDLPDDRTGIFTPERMNEYLATLIPIQVEETVSWNRSLCQHDPRPDQGCSLCLEACTRRALSTENGAIRIDHITCVECGACLATCPTGALQYARFNDRQFLDWFQTAPMPEGTTVVLGSAHALHTLWWKKSIHDDCRYLFVEHPNVRALNCMHLLLPLARGACRIVLLQDPDSENQENPLPQVDTANTILQELFGLSNRIFCSAPGKLGEATAQPASCPLPELYDEDCSRNRREKLGAILRHLIRQGQNGARLTSRLFADFGTVLCDEGRCTHCGACLNGCRIRALNADEATLALRILPIQCVQCGVCVAICPEEALSLHPGLHLDTSFLEERELTRAEPVACLSCGKPFGTRKSFERIMGLIREKDVQVNVSLLEYCDNCRVVKIFEEQQQ